MLQVLDFKTLLVVVHLLGLALGVGGALLLDYVALRFMVTRVISADVVEIFMQLTGLLKAGLALLWVSGLGLLVHEFVLDPIAITNPKIWAKISVVAILTLNGMYLHRAVFPTLATHIGRRLFDGMNPRRRGTLAAAGAVSMVSWLFPVVVGCVERWYPAENFAQGYFVFFGTYAACLGIAVLCAQAFVARRAPAAQTLAAHPAA